MKRYSVSKECIGCRACVGVASDNFDIKNNLAFVKKQPSSKDEEVLCQKAMNVCPVSAISSTQGVSESVNVVLSSSNIKDTLDRYPQLKNVLVELSPKFKRMQNPALYNTLARFANFGDAAKVTGVSICEILHALNKYLGVEDKLLKIMPECIDGDNKDIYKKSVEITWEEGKRIYIYNEDVLEEIVEKISHLKPKGSLIIISKEKPDELIKIADGLGFLFNIEKTREYRLSIFNPIEEQEMVPWQERKEDFEVLDVRFMDHDPFDTIIKKAYEIADNEGFVLIQRFEPHPMINMLTEMGFEYETVKQSDDEFRIYFYKTPKEDDEQINNANKVDVVIQSATPVAYPVIMKLLQSEKIRKHLNITELKVWDETERHLAWITNKKADISFSALITAAKLRNSDIKIPALFVWDNFVLLSRDNIKGFEDLKGKKIYTPLFEEAPPAKITKYIIEAKGLNPDEFELVYGEPFGRPEEIYQDFVEGKADTVILREPEASYAIKIMQDRNEEISIISYNELWNEINDGFGSFPNAGLVFKGEFARQHPDLANMFLDELKNAIDWVNDNRLEAAKMSFDLMRQPVDRIELFLDRVNFNYVDKEAMLEKIKQYFSVLKANKIVDLELDDGFFKIFKLEE